MAGGRVSDSTGGSNDSGLRPWSDSLCVGWVTEVTGAGETAPDVDIRALELVLVDMDDVDGVVVGKLLPD